MRVHLMRTFSELGLLALWASCLPLSHGETSAGSARKSAFVTTTDGVKIHCLEAGPESGTASGAAVLFVPGWTMPAEIWEAQIAYFSKTRRVVAMDPRSQGQSSQTAEGLYAEARARDIKAVIDQLKLDPVVLVGWSMGVSELVAFAHEFGTRGVAAFVFVDGLAGWDIGPGLRGIFKLAADLQKDRLATTRTFVRWMYKKPQSEQYLEGIASASASVPTNTAATLLFSMITADRRPALSEINRPTLIVAAGEPGAKEQVEMQKSIAGSRLEFFQDAGHALFVDDAERFNALLSDFLKNL